MAFWLLKSEPIKYSWAQLEKDKKTYWDGVRNYTARNNLQAMKKGDLAFFYHSNEGMEIVGIAKITKEAFQDPTSSDARWVAVEISPYKKLKNPVSLPQIKKEASLQNMQLVRLSRLSVQSVAEAEWQHILQLSDTK